jgi:phosphohistidine phosphatase
MLNWRGSEIDAESIGLPPRNVPENRQMRRLLLLRHARAERLEAGRADRDRALTADGRGDAARLGRYMALQAVAINHALVSPAARTRETWDIIEEAGVHATARTDDRIYEAEPETLLDIVAETPSGIGTLLMVGHNPGFHAAAAMLVAGGDPALRRRLDDGFPTAALAWIGFDIDDWSRLRRQSGVLERFVSPRSLVGAAE